MKSIDPSSPQGAHLTFARACSTVLALACTLLLLVARPCAAAAYTLDIKGAGALTELLTEFLDISRHSRDAAVSPEELQRLYARTPAQIRDLLATEGYFSPTVGAALLGAATAPVAQFTVDPGQPTLVAEVTLRFTGAIAAGPYTDPQRIQALRDDWSLKRGARFRQADWNAAKAVLENSLLANTFAAARISASEAAIDPANHSAALTIEADSGPAFTFGTLDIHGLTRYDPDMIAHLNPITPGELYSQDKLTDLQSRLQDSGYFRSVFATIETDVAHAELVPVRVDLTELEQRRLSLGAGYSTDVGARLQARWLDRKFLGHNWLLESALQLDRVTPSLGADLSFPALEGQYLNGWRPSLGAHIARSDISNDVIDKFRFDARYTGPDKRNERTIGLSFLTERERLPNVDPNNRQALVATWSLTRRRLDRLISPTEGYVAALEAAAGPRGLFNEANLARLAARANWLLPLTPDWQLQLRGQLGQVYGAARERIPSDLLFLTGGDTSVRGYAYNTLGVARDTAVVGGRVLAVMSAELTHWLTPKYGAAIFQDAGDAADSWGELKLKRSTGIGARLRTPIGPVNLDLAYGQATHATRLHFSVGYGF